MLRFNAPLWIHSGDAPWHFVTVPVEYAEELRGRAAVARRGFGSIRVEATIGNTTWATSVFPDRDTGSYLLPIKRSVRDAEGIDDQDLVAVALDFEQ